MYIKDIRVHGSSMEAALGSLWWVLEVIRAAGLKLQPEKSHFMPLCHKVCVCVGAGGTIDEKMQADSQTDPPPTTRSS